MAAANLEEEKRLRMAEIVSDLKKRMDEIDELGQKIRMEGRLVSPETMQHLLEEIKVPPLKMLKER